VDPCPKQSAVSGLENSLAQAPYMCVTVCNTMSGGTNSRNEAAELGSPQRRILLDGLSARLFHSRSGPRKTRPADEILHRADSVAPHRGKGPFSVQYRRPGAFVHRPVQSRQRVAGGAVKHFPDWLCEGSVEALLVGMVDSKVFDQAELQRLAEHISVGQKNASTGKKGVQ
jgi:BlaI family penicillinase repressor